MKLIARLCCLIVAGCALASCSDGGGRSTVSADPATPQAAATATRDGWATPQTLPITPVAIDFKVTDTQFDALPGARVIFGQYTGGGYQIEVPDAWNGSVVYFAHGFRGNAAELTVSMPPLREYLIAHGYAWAASSYSANGYRPGAGAKDTLALRDVFVEKAGAPKHSYLYGESMGGNVITVSLEQYDAYDGALAECGSLSGQGIVDYFLSWGALAGYFGGTDLTSVTTDAGALAAALRNTVAPSLGFANSLSAKGKAFAGAIEELTGGPRPFFLEGFNANYVFNFALLVNAVAVPGASNAVAQNADTRYAAGDGSPVTAISRTARSASPPTRRTRPCSPEFGPPRQDRTAALTRRTGDLFMRSA
jgi:hypothetical protein